MFDTIHDTGKDDYEFLPDGDMKWTSEKYLAKQKNMSTVLSMLSREKVPAGPAFIGVAEIENRRVLEDLVNNRLWLPITTRLCIMKDPTSGALIVHYFITQSN